jgi:hypothetical protein
LTTPPPPPPYQPGPPAAAAPNNTFGLVSMILGIASIPLACCYLGIPLGIAAAVLGYLGKQKADQGLANNRQQAQVGFITGLVGVGIAVLLFILSVILNVGGFNLPGPA